MMTCQEVSMLVAAGELAEARWSHRLAAWTHLLMCRHCRASRRQLQTIGLVARGTSDAAGAHHRTVRGGYRCPNPFSHVRHSDFAESRSHAIRALARLSTMGLAKHELIRAMKRYDQAVAQFVPVGRAEMKTLPTIRLNTVLSDVEAAARTVLERWTTVSMS